MLPELQVLREQFRDQMPGMAIFDALANRIEQLITAQNDINQRWRQVTPARVKAAIDLLQEIAAAPATPAALKQRILDVLNAN